MNHLLIGLWLFTNIIYRGEVLPRPNPDLIMTLDFQNNGTDTLKYFRNNDSGTCIRNAIYKFDGLELIQNITAVDPNNAYFCDQDPDMQLGRTSINTAYIKDGKLHLELEMGDEVITYIWNRIEKPLK